MKLLLYNRREQIREWIANIAEKFRKKGALSPDKAMSTEELDLPPRFQEAMRRRLGRTGIFVETNGKYYLSEERLKEVLAQGFAREGAINARGLLFNLRIIRMATVILFLILLLINIIVQSWELRLISILVAVVWIIITIIQIYYFTRIRNRLFRIRET